MSTHAEGRDGAVTPDAMIETFIRFDRIAAALALVFVVVANALTYRAGLLWIVPVAIAVQLGLLALALGAIRSGRRHRALAWVVASNWLVAFVVPFALPFLWPIMVVVVLMPLVLSAPHLDVRALALTIVGAGLTAAAVAFVGLESDDGGAIPDIDDAIELVVLIGALVALVVPIALIVWQTNRLQNAALVRSQQLNAELRESERRLADSRRRVVDAADTARSELERDLHDGAQQRLVALRMQMTLLADRLDADGAIAGLIGEVDLIVDELRDLARGIFPPVLEAHGLGEAIAAATRAIPGDVRVAVDRELGRFDPSLERAVYFTALEAVTNAAKHAPGSRISVALDLVGDELALTVVDDGPGFERGSELGDAAHSGGLANMADRVEAVGGTLTLDSGSGTEVAARFPNAAST